MIATSHMWQLKFNLTLILLFIYLFLVALGLSCCTPAFSSCGERGPLFIAVHGLLIAVAFFLKFTFFYLFIYLFMNDCVEYSFLCEGFLQLRQVGTTLHRGARASHHRGLSCCGAQAPDAQAQQLWLTGPVAPWHVGSSQTRARTRVPCIGRQILNHCATREAP